MHVLAVIACGFALARATTVDEALTDKYAVACGYGSSNCTCASVNLTSMGLTGPLPPALGACGALRALDVFGNRISGTIPDALSALSSSLEALVADYNFLSGPVPAWLAADAGADDGAPPPFAALRVLSLYHNELTGAVPASFARGLRELNVAWNHLTGSLPAALGELTAARRIRFDQNRAVRARARARAEHAPCRRRRCHRRRRRRPLDGLLRAARETAEGRHRANSEPRMLGVVPVVAADLVSLFPIDTPLRRGPSGVCMNVPVKR